MLRQLCMEVMVAGGLEGGRGDSGEGKAPSIGQREQQAWWPWGIWGLEADKLGEEGEAGGAGGVGRGRQAGLVHRIRGEVGNPAV